MERDNIRASVATPPSGTARSTGIATRTAGDPSNQAPAAIVHEPMTGQPFFPAVPFTAIWIMGAVFVAVIILALNHPAPLQDPADPLNKALYTPRPEWYFLFLFQLLKYFPGPTEIIATVGIPAIAGAVLIGLPFYDRNPSRDFHKRPVAVACATLAILGLLFLTWQAQGPSINSAIGPLPGVPQSSGSDGSYSGVQAIFTANCASCHGANGSFKTVINLSSWQNVMAGGHLAGGGVIAGPVVKPGDSANSYLWQVVSGVQKIGARMPLGGAALSTVDIGTIKAWIDKGAKGPNGETPPASTNATNPSTQANGSAAPVGTVAAAVVVATSTPGTGVNNGSQTATTASGGTGSATSGTTGSATGGSKIPYSAVQSIFTANCASCHGSAGPYKGLVNLSSYQTLMQGGHSAGGGVVDGPVVKPGSASTSYLYQAVAGQQKVGAKMPLGGQLSSADIKTIGDWIDQGAKGQ